jgi:ABC-2 type transport system ATP-binding protein
LAGSKYSDEDLKQFLTTCGLQEDAFKRPLEGYSKGMRQKVGIAIAYAKKARVLLMDEPSSGLDPSASKELSDLIHKLAKMGTTILMASHDLFRVKETADRIGIINQGQLLKTLQANTVTANDLEEIYLGTVV